MAEHKPQPSQIPSSKILRARLAEAEAELSAWRHDWSGYLSGLERDRSRYLDLLELLTPDVADGGAGAIQHRTKGYLVGLVIDIATALMLSAFSSRRIQLLQLARDKLYLFSPRLYRWQRRMRAVSAPLAGSPSLIELKVQPSSAPALLAPIRLSGRVIEIANLFPERFKRELLQCLVTTLLSQVETYGAVHGFYFLNFFAGGGAEAVTWNYARVASRKKGTIVILLTDRGPRKSTPPLPPNVIILDLTDDARLSASDRMTLAQLLINTANPDFVHIVNSEWGWRML